MATNHLLYEKLGQNVVMMHSPHSNNATNPTTLLGNPTSVYDNANYTLLFFKVLCYSNLISPLLKVTHLFYMYEFYVAECSIFYQLMSYM
jgi:hypothetical protein